MAEMYELHLHVWHVDRCKSKGFLYRIEFSHTHVLFILASLSFGFGFVTSSSALTISILCSLLRGRHLSYRAIVPSIFDNPYPFSHFPPLQLLALSFSDIVHPYTSIIFPCPIFQVLRLTPTLIPTYFQECSPSNTRANCVSRLNRSCLTHFERPSVRREKTHWIEGM